MTALPVPAETSLWQDFAETARFAAVLGWPGNERAQREAVVTWGAAMLGALAETMQRDVVLAGFDAVLARLAEAVGLTVAEIAAVPRFAALRAEIERGEGAFAAARGEAEAEARRVVIDPAGGWIALASARGLGAITADLRRAGTGPEALAGLALALLVCAAEHHAAELPSVSVNRVLWALEGPGQSLRSLKDSWSRAKAPHLWAAFVLEGGGAVMLGPSSLSEDAVAALIETVAGRERVTAGAAWLAEWGHGGGGSSRPARGAPCLPGARCSGSTRRRGSRPCRACRPRCWPACASIARRCRCRPEASLHSVTNWCKSLCTSASPCAPVGL